MVEKRRALGRGLGALIPSHPHGGGQRPVDVLFRDQTQERETGAAPAPSAAGPASAVHSDEKAEAGPTLHRHSDGSDSSDGSESNGDSEGRAGSNDQQRPPGSKPLPPARSYPDDAGLTPVPGAEFAEIDILAISANPRQPRTVFDEDDLAELVLSILEVGVLQPIVVRRVVGPAAAHGGAPPDDSETPSAGAVEGAPTGSGDRRGAGGSDSPPRFELIMGERRWRAAERAGLPRIPAIIKDTHDDDLLRDALLENLHRSQLNALEEAAAYQQLLDDFGCSHDQLATRIGRSRPQISNTLRLLRLPPLVQRRVAAGVLSAGHARAVLGLADGAAMERMAQRIVAEGLSVRTVEELVSLGDDDTPPRQRRPRAGTRHPALDDFTSTLADRLETRVNITLGQRKGKITVEFASIEDLRRIVEVMGVDGEQT